MRRKPPRWLLLAVACLLTGAAVASGQEGAPVPPCEEAPVFPPYPALGASATVRIWTDDEASMIAPPPCTGWKPHDTTALVASAGRFRHDSGVDELLARFGEASALTAIRYWSVSRGRWRTLFESASAVTGPEGGPRADYSAEELKAQKRFYIELDERIPAGPIRYEGRIVALEPDRLVVALESLNRQYLLMFPVFEPGAYQFLYFFEREQKGVWNCYSLIRIGPTLLSGLPDAREHRKSLINRVVAMSRYFAGEATDSGPPPAP